MGRRALVIALAALLFAAALPAVAEDEPPRPFREQLRERYWQASPEERERMLDRWRAFRERREGLRALRHDVGELTPGEAQRIRDRVRALPPQEREDVVRRIARYRSLPEAEQQELRDQLSRYRSLPEAERERIRDNAARFRALPDAEQERLRDAWRRLQQLSPDERERVLDRLLAE